MAYKYASIFEAQNDGKPPNDGIQKGDRILETGKKDKHRITYLDEDNQIQTIEFERVMLIEAPRQMSEVEIVEYAKGEYFGGEADDD